MSIIHRDDDGKDSNVVFHWQRDRLFDPDLSFILYEQCAINPSARVTKVETKPHTKYKPYPLTTVELQKSGSRLLKLSPKEVLHVSSKFCYGITNLTNSIDSRKALSEGFSLISAYRNRSV